jgi:glutathione S-transferase
VLRFVGEAHAQLLDAKRDGALKAYAARREALPVFAETVQPLIPPSIIIV